MEQSIFTVKSNICLAKGVYEMVLGGNGKSVTASGQFINIKLDGFYLRRPISVCDWCDDTITIIYKVVGKGTEYMATLEEGAQLDVLVGLSLSDALPILYSVLPKLLTGILTPYPS